MKFTTFSRSFILLAIIGMTHTGQAVAGEAAGFELDALPYATGGYYGSCWYGRGDWRVRGVFSHVNIPGFAVEKGFDNATNDAAALLIDRFFGSGERQFTGAWIGGGYEYWHNGISRDGSEGTSHYDTSVLTFGGGYIWPVGERLYINPWIAGHYCVGGLDDIDVAGSKYSPDRFLYEASIKLGFRLF